VDVASMLGQVEAATRLVEDGSLNLPPPRL